MSSLETSFIWKGLCWLLLPQAGPGSLAPAVTFRAKWRVPGKVSGESVHLDLGKQRPRSSEDT